MAFICADDARTICSLIVFPSSSTVRILKSTPIVLMYDSVYVSSAARTHTGGVEPCHVHESATRLRSPDTRRRRRRSGTTRRVRLHSPKRSKRHDFPTPLSPISSSLNRKSLHREGEEQRRFDGKQAGTHMARQPRADSGAADTTAEQHRCFAVSSNPHVHVNRKSSGPPR